MSQFVLPVLLQILFCDDSFPLSDILHQLVANSAVVKCLDAVLGNIPESISKCRPIENFTFLLNLARFFVEKVPRGKY